jgi:uncharacterized protein YecE (DUF72 family)
MTKPRSLVGTCGFAEAQDKLFASFDILEVRRTFYRPPMKKTAAKWRDKAGGEFVFTLKAWQLITHESSSPTYRRLKDDLSDSAKKNCGSFKWNRTTRDAWDETLATAEAMDASAVVFQCPKSFRPTTRNLDHMRRFFQEAPRANMRMAFEPRGDEWTDEIVRGLITELDLVQAVDPFIREPVGRGLRYFRLHGRPAYNYSYKYDEDELRELAGKLTAAWPNWVFFNNDAMAEDARKFIDMTS